MSSMLSPEAPRGRFVELSAEEWTMLIAGTAVTVALMAAAWPSITLLVALALGFSVLVMGHLCMTARRYVAFPDLITAAACLQLIVAPVLAEPFPPSMLVFRTPLLVDDYLLYALPALVAFWIGLHLPASRNLSRSWQMAAIEPLAPPVRHTLDAAIAIGIVVDTYLQSFPPQLAFLGYLIGSFRFMGALGWMVTATPGWRWRVGLVLLHLAGVQGSAGMFYLVVHWGGYFVLVYAFMRRWRWKMAAAIVAGVAALAFLQSIKPTYRYSIVEQQVSGPVDALTVLTSVMWDRLQSGYVVDPSARPGDVLVRFNQGWIIARVMTHVPRAEPYAQGRTLMDAVVYAIVPRFLFPSKREGASQDLFEQYTGVDLSVNTRMGLGMVGEMYANFGMMAIAGSFIYGLLIGWVFLWFAARAQRNALWWAAASIVLLPGVEPGFNMEDILNHVVKASVVLFALWQFLPGMQRLLSTAPAERSGGDDQEPLDSDLDDAVAHR